MNIAFDAGAIEAAKGSGVGNYTLNQFKALIENHSEHSFHYFNTLENSTLVDKIKADNFFTNFYFPGRDDFLRFYNGPYRNVYGSLVSNFIRKNKIDVFYITAPFLTTSGIGYNILYRKEWFPDIPVVTTVYDIIPYIMRDTYLADQGAYSWYMSCIDMIRWTDRQLVISASVKNDMVEHLQFDPEKIDVIYGGVDERFGKIEIGESEKSRLYRKFGIDSEFMLGCISADQRKNTHGLIRAYADLPEELIAKHQLVIAGRLSNEGKEKFNGIIAEKRLERRVVLTDYVTDDELLQLYNLAHLMVFPSLYEGFGLPLVESWACGTPVLASNNSSLGELAGDAGLLFDPYDIKDMTRGLREALTNTDLREFTRRGMEKAKRFTWEKVGEWTLESIQRACDGDGKEITKKSRIACVFPTPMDFHASWRAALSRLGGAFDIDVFFVSNGDGRKSSDEYDTYPAEELFALRKRFARIAYFYPRERTCEKALEIMRDVGGWWIAVDEEMDALVEIMAETKGDAAVSELRLANALSRHFRPVDLKPVAEKEIYEAAEVCVVASQNAKKHLLTSYRMKPVYRLAPYDLESSTDLYAVSREDCPQTLLANFKRILTAASPRWNAQDVLDDICREEIQGKAYAEGEVRELAKTLGLAAETDCALQTGDMPEPARIRRMPNNVRVDMVSSWNSKCGIAEYTRFYVTALASRVDFEIIPRKADSLVRDDEPWVRKRVWEPEGSLAELERDLLDSDADIVHIQYTEGFFPKSRLASLLSAVTPRKPVIVSCHNTAYLVPECAEDLDALNKAVFVVHQERDREILQSNGIADSSIRLIPHGQVAAPKRNKSEIREALGISGRHPVIGSYGFLFEHKGFYEVIRAVGLLKKDFPDILYIASCALYNVPPSIMYYDKCRSTVDSLGLGNNVRMVTDFLKPEESLYLLQACDICAMPYHDTAESASGAIRFCVAARRPLLTTRIPIFREYAEYTCQIADNSPKSLAKGIAGLLRKDTYDRFTKLAEHSAEEHSWDAVGNRYFELYNAMLRRNVFVP